VNLLRPRSNVRQVLSDDDGTLAGLQREHWDDHVDAKGFPRLQFANVGDGIETPGFYAPGLGLIVRRKRRPWQGVRQLVRSLHLNEVGAFATNSGMYLVTWIDVMDATQLAIDTSLTTHKIALYTNSIATMSYSADSAQTSAPYNANEASGAGYTAGGQVIVSPTTTESPTGTIMYDLGDQIWASPTTVTARGGVEYANGLAGKNLMFAWQFGSDIVSTAGTFSIVWNALGAATWDITP
jgi:hypothetical protein